MAKLYLSRCGGIHSDSILLIDFSGHPGHVALAPLAIADSTGREVGDGRLGRLGTLLVV